jgi:hypothetical protein
MCEQQLDLFSSADIQADRPLPLSVELCAAATVLDDQALIAAIPDSNLADSTALAAEAGRRRLVAAVPSLETLCRRFSGFGIDRMVPEQAAALRALAAIGGREAAQAVSQLIVRGVVQGPTLNLAVSTAARIGSTLPNNALLFAPRMLRCTIDVSCGSIPAAELRGRHGRTCFDSGHQRGQVVDLRQVAAVIGGRPRHAGDGCSPETCRHGR